MVTIDLDIFRVTEDGKYLEIVASCNKTQAAVFTKIELQYWTVDGLQHSVNLTRELLLDKDATAITGSDVWLQTPVIATRIDIEQALGLAEPIMALVTLDAHSTSSNEQVEINAMASDVHNVYQYLVAEILKAAETCNGCINPTSELYTKYLLLWAHITAMQNKQVEDALTFFKIINKNFRHCGGKGPIIGCGCGK